MDEVKTLEENLTTNGEGSANLVKNEELEPENEQEAITDPKPLDSPIDDPLTLSQEPLILEENKSNDPPLSERQDHDSSSSSSVPSETSEPEAYDSPTSPESPSEGLTKGEICNNEEACNEVSSLEKVESEKQLQKSIYRNAVIDTAAPFESVKAAVSMFGGIVDWKAHKIQTAQRRKFIIQELMKANEEIPLFRKKSKEAEEAKLHVLKELDETKRQIEELKLNLEKTQTEERQAKQDAELAKLRVEEMEQGIADDSSVAAKIQLEVAQARHQAAVSELETVKTELENIQKDYDLLVNERGEAIKNAKEAVSNSKEIEKAVEGLTIKLITTKEALESAHAAHLEAEEQRIGIAMAREQDALNWEKELKQSEEELEKLNQRIVSVQDLNSKLDTASVLLRDLKAELAAYMGENGQDSESNESKKKNINTHKDMQVAIGLAKVEFEEVTKKIEKATDEVKSLKVVANTLNSELEGEKATLIAVRQREGMASVAVASLDTDLTKTVSEIAVIQTKEKEAREKTVELPKQLQKAAEETARAKSRARAAYEELQKAKERAEQAKAGANTMRSKLHAAQKEIEASRASERLALGAISALQESESAQSKSEETSGVTISLEEYYELTRKAQEADNQANVRVSEAMSQIDVAKESESKALNRLEEMNSDLVSVQEQLTAVKQKADKAQERKLAVEQELRTWRSENEQRRIKEKENGGHKGVVLVRGKTPKGTSELGGKEGKSSDVMQPHKGENATGSSLEGIGIKPRKKKKRFIPRFLMFFSRKKGHSNKNAT